MSFEVEVKYQLVDHDRLRGQLAELGAEAGLVVQQVDTYLNHPGAISP